METGGIDFRGLSGKSLSVAYQQDQKFGILDIAITYHGKKLQGKFYTNDGSMKDQFNISIKILDFSSQDLTFMI